MLKAHRLSHNYKRQRSFVHAPFSSTSLLFNFCSPRRCQWRIPLILPSNPMLYWSRWSSISPLMPEKRSPRKSAMFISLIFLPRSISLFISSTFSNFAGVLKFWIRFELLAENRNWWGGLYHWSQERGGYQRLGFLIFISWIWRFSCVRRHLICMFLLSPFNLVIDHSKDEIGYSGRWIYLLIFSDVFRCHYEAFLNLNIIKKNF